jgi:transcriptional regulator with XRE-family HTH domain
MLDTLPVRTARRLADVTQEELASHLGISRGWLSMVERGVWPMDSPIRKRALDYISRRIEARNVTPEALEQIAAT